MSGKSDERGKKTRGVVVKKPKEGEGKKTQGLTVKKSEDLSEWYVQSVLKAELVDYSPVKGCMVIRPWGMAIWELIQKAFNEMIQEDDVGNAYFPLLIPESYLEKEKDIVEGFDPEVAWVTHAGHEELEERLAIRPTSESIICAFFAKWVRSYRDLPLRVNQWCNIIRWEGATYPFLRTREFLWQEGHTVHDSHESAAKEVEKRRGNYKRLYEEFLCLPVITGRKPQHDRFPGAEYTTAVEALMPDGLSLQGATSHHLGQNFAKAYDIVFRTADEKTETAWTTSWGLSMRSIGGMLMAHGDDRGLILPPSVAPKQVVIVPIFRNENMKEVVAYSRKVFGAIRGGFRVVLDDDEVKTPGFKFNEWDLKGVPLRVDIGPKEMKDGTVTLVRRDTKEKKVVKLKGLSGEIEALLELVSEELRRRHRVFLGDHMWAAKTYKEVGKRLKKGGYVKATWDGDESVAEDLKDHFGAHIVLLGDEKVTGSAVLGDGKAKYVAYVAKKY